jgi:lactate racemase
VRIGIGEVSPVGPAGWCGGGKIILPGVAGRDTIEHNHRMVMSPEVRLGAIERNPVRLDMEEAADLARLDLKLDVLVNSAEQVVDLYAGDFRVEWRTAVAAAKKIWTTPMTPTDLAVLYPGDTRERFLGGATYMTLGIGDAMTVPGGAIVLSLSAAGGWSSEPHSDRHGATPEQFALSTAEMTRQMVRSQGNLRSWSNAYMAKVIVERKPIFLHCDGFTDAEARELGFAGAFRTLEETLAAAAQRIGNPDATLSVSVPRGIQWRMMPRVDD